MKRLALVAALALVTFAAGAAVARAEFGWERLSAPCAVANLAISGSEIAITCQGSADTILIKQR